MLVVAFPDQSWIDAVGPLDGVRGELWQPDGPLPDETEVVVAPYMSGLGYLDAVAASGTVRLLQLLTAGYDGVLERLRPEVLVANARGVHDAATSELALALTLASLRGLDEMAAAQTEQRWLPGRIRPGLAGRRVLLLGYGAVGRAIARRLVPFEVTITAVASRPRAGDELVAQVHGVDELSRLAADHDVLISVLPGSPATDGVIDERVLAALPDGGLVVNVGRGPALVTDAALRHAGRLRLALDVTDPEPLPPGHPLWSAPGVIISPHTGGVTEAFRPRAAALLRDQLGRLARGEDPINLVG